MTDAHLEPASRNPRHMERVITGLFFVGLLGFAAFGAAYWQNWAAWTLGTTLGVGMFAVGAGMTAWGKYLLPRGPFVEERHELASSPEDLDRFTNAVVARGGIEVRRRKMLGGMLGAGLGVFGVVAAFPLIRSLGPLPGDTLQTTDWRAGSYLVDQQGRRIHRGDMGVGSIATVFPEGLENTDTGQAVDQTILIHAEASSWTPAGQADYTPEGFVAYSKLCTHAGCPVGLYERALQLLVCPCHQSMFNIVDKGLPIFGPAPRPLPQLPIAFDAAGFLYAVAGYNQAVGPGFWERS